MCKLIMWNLITLDGFFEGDLPWSLDFHSDVWGPELERVSIEQGDEIGGLLFGRKTYQGMAAYWPTATDETNEVTAYMNALPKVVFSRTLAAAEWHNTRLVKTDPVAEVRRLKTEPGKDLFLFGSADLASTLSAAGLIDEYRLGLTPIVLGRGNPLFKPADRALRLTLIDSRPLSNGCLILRYVPATGEVTDRAA
jgi:dihydrofolate reductase